LPPQWPGAWGLFPEPEGTLLFRGKLAGSVEELRYSTSEWMSAPRLSDDGLRVALTMRDIRPTCGGWTIPDQRPMTTATAMLATSAAPKTSATSRP
jgi:hypothetical protein